MPTDDERRAVARRLRETGEELGSAALLWYHIAKALGVRTATDGKTACGMLADLIEPDEQKVKCIAEIKIDGERLEQLVNDAVVEVTGIDRERLLAIATVMAADSVRSAKQGNSFSPVYILHAARNIAEACGETFGSIRNRELAKWGTSIVPKETIVDRDALLEEVKELEKCAWYFGLDFDEDEPLRDRLKEASEDFAGSARRIREALGVDDG